MVQLTTSLLFLSASLVASQSPTIDSFLLRAEDGKYVGSIVSVHKSLTTVVVNCDAHTKCNWVYDGATITQGEATMAMQFTTSSDNLVRSQAARCEFNQTQNAADCGETRAETHQATKSTTHIERIETAYSNALRPVVITAGTDKLPEHATGVYTSEVKETGSVTTSSGNAAPMATGNLNLVGLAAAAIGALAL